MTYLDLEGQYHFPNNSAFLSLIIPRLSKERDNQIFEENFLYNIHYNITNESLNFWKQIS